MARRITKNDMLLHVPAVAATPFIPGSKTVIKTWPVHGLTDAMSRDIYNTIGNWSSGGVRGRFDSTGTMIEAYRVTPASPATGGTPAKIVDTGVAAWNAGGSAVTPLDGDGAYEFYVGDNPGGVVAGLTTTDLTTQPGEVTHGFYVHGSIVQIIESGVVVHTFDNPSTYETRFVIRRVGQTVFYTLDQPVQGFYTSEFYTSTQNITTYKVRLDVALYLSGDYVESPVLFEGSSGESVGTIEGVLEPIAGRVGNSNLYIYGKLKAIQGQVFRAPAGATGFVVGSTPPLSGYAVVTLVAQMYVAGVLRRAAGVVSNYAYSYVDGELPTLLGEVTDVDPSFFRTADSSLSIGDTSAGIARMYAATSSELRLASTMLATIRMADSIFDALMLADPIASTQSMADTIMSALRLGTDIGTFLSVELPPAQVAARAPSQYAVNVLTGALTTYDGFDFQSFALSGQTTYGARVDGVYRVRPGDDAGAPRVVAVDFGTMGLDTTTVKTIEAVFLGIDTDGEVFIRLVAEGDDTLYRVIERGSVSRALGKRGVGSRQWNVSLEVANATHLNLDMIELSVASMTRRWSSR